MSAYTLPSNGVSDDQVISGIGISIGQASVKLTLQSPHSLMWSRYSAWHSGQSIISHFYYWNFFL
jgi:uncharacterized membrane protein